jgi:hypothetical protein
MVNLAQATMEGENEQVQTARYQVLSEVAALAAEGG